jgi:hypothetical protein
MKRISDPRKFRSAPPKDFFNNIGQKRLMHYKLRWPEKGQSNATAKINLKDHIIATQLSFKK